MIHFSEEWFGAKRIIREATQTAQGKFLKVEVYMLDLDRHTILRGLIYKSPLLYGALILHTLEDTAVLLIFLLK